MTVVAAWAEHGNVWMAADDASVDGVGRIWPHARKVNRLPTGPPRSGGEPGEVLLAQCGTTELGSLARQHLKLDCRPDPADGHDCDTWADSIAAALTEIAIEARPAPTDGDGYISGAWLLGHAGRLWHITQHVAQPIGRYTAIGSGGDLALGALEAFASVAPTLTPSEAVTAAAEAACRWDRGCRPPIRLHMLVA